MNLLSSPQIEKAIAKKTLRQWDLVKYSIMLPLTLGFLLASPYLWRALTAPENPPYFAAVASLSLLVSAYIAYRGVKLCYTVNERSDGKAFLERYAALAVPPFLQLLLVALPLGVLLWLLSALDSLPLAPVRANFGLIAYLALPILTVVYFTLLRLSFKRLGRLLAKK